MSRSIKDFFLPSTPKAAKRRRSHSSPPDLESERPKKQQMDFSEFGIAGNTSIKDVSIDDFFRIAKKTLATKDDLQGINSSIEVLKNENAALKAEVAALKEKEDKVLKQLDDLENRSRRNNLVFRGLVVEANKDCGNAIKDFCANILGCRQDLVINRAHTIPMSKKDRSPPIIAHFPRDEDIHHIFQNVKKLQGTAYSISRDFSREVRTKRSYLFQLKKEIEKQFPTARVRLVFDHLYVLGTKFHWSQDKGLTTGKDDGIPALNRLFNSDFTGIVWEIRNKRPGANGEGSITPSASGYQQGLSKNQ